MAKKAKPYKNFEPIIDEEISFHLPKNWEVVRLGRITDLVSGVTKGRKLANRETATFPYLRVANVQRGYLDLKVIKEIEIPVEELDKYELKSGDVLLTEGGDWDKLGRAAIWEHEIPRCIHQNHVFRARLLDSSLIPKWVILYTNSRIGRQYFETAAKRTTNLASINMTQLRNCPFPVPPLAEQKRIVEACDRILTLCDKIDQHQQQRHEKLEKMNEVAISKLLTAQTPDDFDTHWQRLWQNFDLLYSIPETIPKLRQAILQLAVQGKLVEQDPNDEPVEVQIDQLKNEKNSLIKAKKIPKAKKLEPLGDEMPHGTPDSWRWLQLGELAQLVEYGTSEKSSEVRDDVPVFRMNNIQNGQITFDNLKYVPSSIKDLPRLYLQRGDILFNRTNSYELVGKTGTFNGEDNSYTFASYLIRVRLFTEFTSPEFVNLAMNSTYFRQTQIEPEITQQCGQANFNGTKLCNTLIPFPPLAEQKRIVAKVDRLMALCDAMEAKLTAARAQRETLMEAAARQVLAL